MDPTDVSSTPDKDRLRGWKDIAAHLQTTHRTAQRWEQILHLPVHRIRLGRKSIVFSSRRAIESWLDSALGRSAVSRENTRAAEQTPSDPHSNESPANRKPTAPARAVTSAITVEDGSDSEPSENSIECRPHGPAREELRTVCFLGLAVALATFATVGHRQGIGNTSALASVSFDVGGSAELTAIRPDLRGVVVRLTFNDGTYVRVGIAFGDVATCAVGRLATYALTAERLPDGARVHVSRFETEGSPGSPPLSELGVWSLRFGESVGLAIVPGVATLQLELSRGMARTSSSP